MITAAIVIATWLAVNATLLAVALWRAYLKLQQEQRSRWEVSHRVPQCRRTIRYPAWPQRNTPASVGPG